LAHFNLKHWKQFNYQIPVHAIEFDESSGFFDSLLFSLVRRFVINAKSFTLAVDTNDAPWVTHISDVELEQRKDAIVVRVFTSLSEMTKNLVKFSIHIFIYKDKNWKNIHNTQIHNLFVDAEMQTLGW